MSALRSLKPDAGVRPAGGGELLTMPLDVQSPGVAARVLQLQAAVLAHERFLECASAFAAELAALLRFDRAAIGFTDRGRSRVVATSHTADFEPNAALTGAFASVMDEALDQASTVNYPEPPGARPLVTVAHAALARTYGGSVCTVPLVANGRAFGALTLVRTETASPSADEIALAEHLVCIVGPVLELKYGAERAWHERLRDSARGGLRTLREPGHIKLKLAAGLGLALLLAVLLVPVPYRVGAEARVEGAVQRALVAPADGFLRHIHARPGDRVTADQVLAELAEDDLKLEQRKWLSELTQHENAASAALARTDRAQYVINQAKADEARAQLDLAERQLARSRVLAPFDGVVIKGDLSQSLGAPVRRGDVLLTVAPSDRFRLLIEVDERDIGAVQVGRKGTVALGALTDSAPSFRVARVTPVLTARDGRNFYEVEGELEHASAALRPGLQGVAKIEAGHRTLAWSLTHRLREWLRLLVWRWGF